MITLTRLHLLLLFVILSAVGSGCSLKPDDGSGYRVRIAFPGASQYSSIQSFSSMGGGVSLVSGASTFSFVGTPSTLDDFTCFGLNVTGPDILRDFRIADDSGCSSGMPYPGLIGGLTPVSGGEVEMLVPAGSSRTFQLFAVRSTIGCPLVENVLNSNQFGTSMVEYPFEVGRATADIFGDTTLNIHASYNAATPKKMFCPTQSSSVTLTSVTPVSPNNSSTSPTLVGTLSPSFVTIRFYSDSGCTTQLSTGSKSQYESTGLSVPVSANATTTIYGQGYDGASVPGACVFLTNYTHDNTAPTAPSFTNTNPPSPSNNSTAPLVYGNASADTTTVNLYSDVGCGTQIGTGTQAAFNGAGITATVGANATTNIYAKAFDALGNATSCIFLTAYGHDNLGPSNPTFSGTTPASPSNTSTTPTISGGASADTAAIWLYSDSGCTNALTSGPRSTWISPGLSVSVGANSTTMIYAQARDAVGNLSGCVAMATYTHDNTAPSTQSITSVTPSSPSNTSNTPTVMGALGSADTSTVQFFSDATCSTSIGSGSGGLFTSTGIVVTVPLNTSTTIYGKAIDGAGNASGCSGALATYVHDNMAPSSPSFGSFSPVSPSNSSSTPLIMGTAASADTSAINFYSDSGCSTQIGTGTRAAYQGAGITLSATANASTNVYGKTFDAAGNASACTFLSNFIHDNSLPSVSISAPTPGVVVAGGNSVGINWSASDSNLTANPITLAYSTDSGTTWNTIASSLSNSGSYSWTAPSLNSNQVQVRVSAADTAGNTQSATSSLFTIDSTAPSVSVSAPIANQQIAGGSNTNIAWTATDANFGVSPIMLEYSVDGGATWSTIVSAISNTGSYSWSVPYPVNTIAAVVRVTATDQALLSANAATPDFTIDSAPPSLNISSPTENVQVKMWSFTYDGNCETGRMVDITYGPGVNGPGSDPCTSGTFAVNVNYAGNSNGNRSVTFSQSDAAGNNTTVTRNVNFEPHWIPMSMAGAPSARRFHTTVNIGSEIIIWGGEDNGGAKLNDGAKFDPVSNSWTAISTSGAPGGRISHTAVTNGTIMMVWGGNNGVGAIGGGGRYDPALDTWSTMSATGAPTPRMDHVAVWGGGKMAIWGGYNGVATYYNTGANYDPFTDTWTTMMTSGAPTAAAKSAAVFSGTYMVVWGGTDGTAVGGGGRYSISGNTWSAMAAGPTSRYNHTAVWTGTEMIVWGGTNGSTPVNTGSRYNPGTNIWTATSTTGGVPTARQFHTAVWDGAKMVIWGGMDGSSIALNDGSVYDPTFDSWTTLSTGWANTPSVRYQHSAFWFPGTPGRMIIWGGFDGTSVTDSGGIHIP